MKTTYFEADFQDELKVVPLSHIVMNPYQPRREFNHADLEELAQSIRSVGLLHPPLVRPLQNNCYELISGERRFRAAKLASLSSIPVYIRKTDSPFSAQAALIENIQRVNLNPLEISKALKRLMVEFGWKQDQLAQHIGKKRSTIANYLRLLTLPPLIQESLSKEKITMGHAKAILALDQEKEQLNLHAEILHNDLNVREAEQAASSLRSKERKRNKNVSSKDCFIERVTEKIRDRFGTRVFIHAKGKKGRITIDYYNLDDLDRLIILFGIQDEC